MTQEQIPIRLPIEIAQQIRDVLAPNAAWEVMGALWRLSLIALLPLLASRVNMPP